MLPVLRGIYHIRVEYPDDKKLNNKNMISVTSHCDPSLTSPNLKCIQSIAKSIFTDKKIKDAELSYIFCDDIYLSKLKKKFLKKDHFTDVIAFRLNNYDRVKS